MKFVFLVVMSTGLFYFWESIFEKLSNLAITRMIGEILDCAPFPCWCSSVEEVLGTWEVYVVFKK